MPASADPNMQVSQKKKSAGYKAYESYVYNKELDKKDRLKEIDFTGNGKVDCKRQFFSDGKKLKKEICDYNYDGVVDEVLEMNRQGLIVKHKYNNDSDKAFEKVKTCVLHKKDKSIALCEVKIETLKGQYSVSRHYEISDLFLREAVGKKKKKKRNVASTPAKPYSDERLVDKDFKYDDYIADIAKHNKGLAMAAMERWDDNWGNTHPNVRKFFQVRAGYHPSQNHCLKGARDCCYYSTDYTKVQSDEGPQGKYMSCLSFASEWCSKDGVEQQDPAWCMPDGSVTEGDRRPCFDCLSDKLGKILSEEEKKIFNSSEVGEIVETGEYYQVKPYSVMFHKSCDIAMPEPGKENEFNPIFREIPMLDELKKCIGDPPTDTQGVRFATSIARMVNSQLYKNFARAANIPVEGKEKPLVKWSEEEIPLVWSDLKRRLQAAISQDPSLNRGFRLDEADGKLKVMCLSTSTNLSYDEYNGLSTTYDGDSYTGEVKRDEKGNFKRFFQIGGTIIFDPTLERERNWNSGSGVHELFHSFTGGHGDHKKVLDPKTGKEKYRCNWTPEPDYANLCQRRQCKKDGGKFHCTMGSTEHFVDVENGNHDLKPEYIKVMRELLRSRHSNGSHIDFYKLVDDKSECRDL